MIDTAAGLAATGITPFTGSFAVFATGRAYDQVRNTVCYSDLSVKLCPTHAGITVGPDGGSHQMIEDIALMRVLPRMRVLVPADYIAARRRSCASPPTRPGPFYVRLGRATVPVLYDDDFAFELGRAYVLREGADVTLVACGVMVERALAAAELLAADGVSAEVIDCWSIKPLDADTIVASAAKTRRGRDVRGALDHRRARLGRRRGAGRAAAHADGAHRRARHVRHVGRPRGAHAPLRPDGRGHRGLGPYAQVGAHRAARRQRARSRATRQGSCFVIVAPALPPVGRHTCVHLVEFVAAAARRHPFC